MTRRSPTNDRTAVRQARALAIQDIERCYKHWAAFLAEKRAELVLRQAVDEAADDLLETPQAAQPRRARLLPAVRSELTSVLRMRQQEAQEREEAAARQAGVAAPDPDTVYAALLNLIGDELAGKQHPHGMALVWYEGMFHEFNHRATMRATTDDDYLTTASQGALPGGKQMIIIGVGAGLAVVGMLVAFYFLFLAEPAQAVASGPVSVAVGQQNVVLWDTAAATVGAVSAPLKLRAGYPLRLCVTAPQQQAATVGATLLVTGTDSVRAYRLTSPATKPVDALILDCGSSPARTLAAAMLVETTTHRPLERAGITNVTVWGSDTDPATIPQDRMLIEVLVTDADGAQGTLILADGSRYAATNSTPVAGGVAVRYLVPVSSASQRVGYERTAAGALPAVLSLDLPVPISRIVLLRRVLQVRSAQARVVIQDGMPTLALTLDVALAADAAPVTLLPTDLRITQPNGTAVEGAVWTPPTLDPGAAAQIQLRLPLPQADGTLELTLANWRTQLALKE